MNIVLTILCLQPLILVTLYLYVSGVFKQSESVPIDVVLYRLGLLGTVYRITIRLSPGYDLLASTAELLSEVLLES